MTTIEKAISKMSHYSVEQFEKDAKQYILAIKERRMICSIHSVASSGMSRVLSFHSCEKSTYNDGYWYSNYHALFIALGYKSVGDGFRVHGCGMDMVFATNYDIMHILKNYGLIDGEECSRLCQMTPNHI